MVSAIKRMERKRMRVRGASTRPAMSPTVWPRLRIETTSEPKSCTAPIRMEPKSTQRSAGTQPQMTASAGPTNGPGAGNRGEMMPENDALLGGYVVDVIVQLDAWNRCFRVKPKNLAGQELTVGVVGDEVEDEGS